MLVTACAGRAPAGVSVATPTPVAIATPAPTPTSVVAPVDDRAGAILFGARLGRDQLVVPNPKTTFDRRAKEIAWVAHLAEPAAADKLTWQLLRVRGGSEKILWTEKVTVSPDWTITSSHAPLPRTVFDNKAGRYVMRYSRGGTVLAEGSFTLK